MRILICCEFYAPSIGGVQKVMQEVAEHLVLRGHEISVATTALPERTGNQLNGVNIQQFDISGNRVRGLSGDVDRYRNFVLQGAFDAILVKAAQQWSFDALWEILPDIRCRKVHIPCGYSGLREPGYEHYFQQMPDILRKFDHLIFYANNYRDIDFARHNGCMHFSVIPNGASEIEFAAPPPLNIRGELSIPAHDFVFLTVGNPPFQKGHLEVTEAYEKIRLPFGSTLILNGSYAAGEDPGRWSMAVRTLNALKQLKRAILPPPAQRPKSFAGTISAIRRQTGKRVIIADLAREKLLAAFFTSNLFVFASRVEYSPLVLFESAAAGLPFLSVPAGNAEEIAQWTGGGRICPAEADGSGYIQADPAVLAREMQRLAQDPGLLLQLRNAGREGWKMNFTWKKIAAQYERILAGEQP
jgi:glycosyltransferase involved in cell wall biosynthesis